MFTIKYEFVNVLIVDDYLKTFQKFDKKDGNNYNRDILFYNYSRM